MLRELALNLPRNSPRKRGQPPKTKLAAAKMLDLRYPAAAARAAREAIGVVGVAGAAGSAARTLSPSGSSARPLGETSTQSSAQSSVLSPAGSGLDAASELELNESATTIVGGLDALELWLGSGQWAPPRSEPPPLLLAMIEEAALELSQRAVTVPKIGELIEGYRDLMLWGASFVEQRPPDQADRDELVLLTAVRIKLLHQPQMNQDPVMTRNLLSDSYGRLPDNWGEETAVGVAAYSKGHFGNDQDLFNDVCRAIVVDLLDRAMAKADRKTIYLTTTIFDRSTGRLRAELDQKIGECLAAGWRVVHVLDRSRSVDDDGGAAARVQADFATHMVADLETQGRYVPIRNAPNDSTDMALVEGVGAVVFPSVGHSTIERSRPGSTPSPAMAIRCITGRGGSGGGPAATPIVGELRAEARALYGAAAEETYLDKRVLPFGFRIPTDDLLWFDRQLTASELLEGDRYAMKSLLPTSTLPDDLSAVQFDGWRRQLRMLLEGERDPDGLASGWSVEVLDRCTGYLSRRGGTDVEYSLKRLQNKRNVRHFAFETNITHNRYRDCVLKSKLLRYMTDENPWFDPNPLYGAGGLDLEHRHQHLVYLANELEKTRVRLEQGERIGYTLGLIDDEEAQPYELLRTWWLATRSADGRADQVHYIHDPAGRASTYVAILKEDWLAEFEAVDTFVSLFDGVWYTINFEDRFPAQVIEFILDRLPASARKGFRPRTS